MLATILKSPQATQATLAIIETFATVRQLKRQLRTLHNEADRERQQSGLQRLGKCSPASSCPTWKHPKRNRAWRLTSSSAKIKHTVKRVRKPGDPDRTEVE